ncbi:HAMP domain-containing sensor histidine kinase [Shimia sp. R9_3]|uniref:sensor histidine kinase n=1 Tax=Shimia sp. R9_3 TaxID=2821113 RepID=UPI001ADBDF99|nr:HAMP domain-containing sensor histidine kinase [Shimia sp. R9_3]MBO9403437.1 HAMP domain-containing histidine kinase [Shimia sp. R9_3]
MDRLDEFTTAVHSRLLRENLCRSVAAESRAELMPFGLNEYELLHIDIVLDMTGRSFFFSEKSDSRASFISINIVTSGGSNSSYRMLKHYLETELRNEYQSHIFQSLISTSSQVESSVEFSDPSDLYILYLESLSSLVPDIDLVFWRFASEQEFLQCDACSDATFDCDVLDLDHPLLALATKGNRIDLNSLALAKKEESTGLGVYSACHDNGWRSASFRPVSIGRSPAGLLGAFVRYPGGVPTVYEQFVDFVLQQTARFLAEQQRITDLMLLKSELKKLVPLLAVGNEVLQRNHDIRDQITVVRSNLITIRDSDIDEPHSRIVSNATSALDAIQRMTDVLSKQLQGFRSAKDSRKSARISLLIKEVEERMRVVSGIENVDFEVEIESDPLVRVQRFYIERVIENVVGNALYFSKQTHGANTVRVRVWRADGFAQIQVTDNGPGISQNPPSKVFELGETTKPDGYGIGLAIAGEIIESHGGAISASNGPSGGANFLLMLPEAMI